MDNLERHGQNPSRDVSPLVRMRCPTCRKLYSVEMNQLQQVSATLPRFECVACKTKFAAITPLAPGELSADTFIFDPLTIEEPKLETPAVSRRPVERAPLVEERSCPKCGNKNSRSAAECKRCGIVFSKYRPDEDERVSGEIQLIGRHELVALWKDVMDRYEDEPLHEKFVRACADAGCLPFASHKYARILSATPEEETAKKMRRRIIALASQKLEFRGSNIGWKFRVPGFNGMVILMGSMVATIGLLLPHARNLTGVGVSMVALAIGVRFFLNRSE